MDIKQEQFNVEEDKDILSEQELVVKQEDLVVKDENFTEEVTLLEPHNQQDYCCAHCPFQTDSRQRILYHLKIHVSKRLYKCDHCNFATVYSWIIKRHKKRSNAKVYHCKQCTFWSSFKCSFDVHKASCKVIKVRVDRRLGINRPDQLYCNNCSYNTKEKRNLESHVLVHLKNLHNSQALFICAACDKSFKHEGSFKFHMKRHISGNDPYRCKQCDYTTYSRYYLGQHELTHSFKLLFKCDSCEKNFKNARSYKFHMMSHTNEKDPYRCKECNYSTYSKNYLKQHESIHSGEKLFKCDICQKSYRFKHAFTQHMRKHTGENIIECKECDYQTTTKSKLNVHMRTHRDEKPFACEQCAFRTKAKHVIERHKLHIHPVDKNCVSDKSKAPKKVKIVEIKDMSSINFFDPND